MVYAVARRGPKPLVMVICGLLHLNLSVPTSAGPACSFDDLAPVDDVWGAAVHGATSEDMSFFLLQTSLQQTLVTPMTSTQEQQRVLPVTNESKHHEEAPAVPFHAAVDAMGPPLPSRHTAMTYFSSLFAVSDMPASIRRENDVTMEGKARGPFVAWLAFHLLPVVFALLFVCLGLHCLLGPIGGLLGMTSAAWQMVVGTQIEWPERASRLVHGKWMVVDACEGEVRHWVCEDEDAALKFFRSLSFRTRALFNETGSMVQVAYGLDAHGDKTLNKILSHSMPECKSAVKGKFTVIVEETNRGAKLYAFSSHEDAVRCFESFSRWTCRLLLDGTGREIQRAGWFVWSLARLRRFAREPVPGMVGGRFMIVIEDGRDNILYFAFKRDEMFHFNNFFDSLGPLPRLMFDKDGRQLRAGGSCGGDAWNRIRLGTAIRCFAEEERHAVMYPGQTVLEVKDSEGREWQIMDRSTSGMVPDEYMVVIEAVPFCLKYFVFGSGPAARTFFGNFNTVFNALPMILYAPSGEVDASSPKSHKEIWAAGFNGVALNRIRRHVWNGQSWGHIKAGKWNVAVLYSTYNFGFQVFDEEGDARAYFDRLRFMSRILYSPAAEEIKWGGWRVFEMMRLRWAVKWDLEELRRMEALGKDENATLVKVNSAPFGRSSDDGAADEAAKA